MLFSPNCMLSNNIIKKYVKVSDLSFILAVTTPLKKMGEIPKGESKMRSQFEF